MCVVFESRLIFNGEKLIYVLLVIYFLNKKDFFVCVLNLKFISIY